METKDFLRAIIVKNQNSHFMVNSKLSISVTA
jgi:hypothetical protein